MLELYTEISQKCSKVNETSSVKSSKPQTHTVIFQGLFAESWKKPEECRFCCDFQHKDKLQYLAKDNAKCTRAVVFSCRS